MATTDLEAATEALEAGDWEAAHTAFEAVLARNESAEALLGLGDALAWQGETEAAIDAWQRAYGLFLRPPEPDPAQAVGASATRRTRRGRSSSTIS